MNQRGGVILEAAIGVAVALPLLIGLYASYGYLQSVTALRAIAHEATQNFDINLFQKVISFQDMTVTKGDAANMAAAINAHHAATLRRLSSFSRPRRTSIALAYQVSFVEVDLQTGKALNILPNPIIVPPRESLHPNVLNALQDLVTHEFSSLHNTAPFPSALPHGLQGITQSSYLGVSNFYSQSTPSHNDLKLSNFLRYAPIIAVHASLDVSQTYSAQVLSRIPGVKNTDFIAEVGIAHARNPL